MAQLAVHSLETALQVLVVIPTLNEAGHITTVLESLLAERPPNAVLRVVAVDGGSTDGTAEIVRALARSHERLDFLHNPERVQSAAVNAAVRRFGRDADVLIRCDAHAEYPPDYCTRLLATLARTEADAVVVPMDSVGEGSLRRAIAWVSNSVLGTGGSAHRAGHKSGFVDHGHHAAFRMGMFQRCGGYDESFTHNEDAEFDCRQRALGARVYLDAEIRLGYHPRGTFTALFWQYFRYGAGRSRTVRRHPASVRLRQLAVPGNLALLLSGLALGPWFWVALVWPLLYVALLAGSSLGFALRRRAWCGLLTGPAAGVMHTAWALGFIAGLVARRERIWRPEMTVPLGLATSTGERS
jgi:succinoglycan biosynthesis protein ExoA